ncbi:MAG: DsbA family protein [Pseudomonadota bacterium]
MLTIYLDFKSPAAYLAMKPTLALVGRLGLEAHWKPFRTVERDVPKLGKEETVGESHRRVRAASQRAIAVKYAKLQGIDLKFPETLGGSDLALGMLSAIEGDPLPFIRAAFKGYWKKHEDLDDLQIVQGLIHETGTQVSVDPSKGRILLDAAQEQAEEAGIVGAPAYVIGDQIFVGREHLPWIEEIALSL